MAQAGAYYERGPNEVQQFLATLFPLPVTRSIRETEVQIAASL